MAYLEDYRPEDERAQEQTSVGPGSSFTPTSPVGPSSTAEQSAGSGFQPLSDYFTANADSGAKMAGDIAADVTKTGAEAVQNWDPGKVPAAVGATDAIESQEGIAGNLQQRTQDPRYSSGMAGLDAYVAQRGSGGRFDDMAKQFGALDWNFVGQEGPAAPDGKPTAPNAPKYESSMSSLPGGPGGPGDVQYQVNLHNANLDAQKRNDAAKAQYEKQMGGYNTAMGEFNKKNDAYLTEKKTYDDKRKEFLTAFGLG